MAGDRNSPESTGAISEKPCPNPHAFSHAWDRPANPCRYDLRAPTAFPEAPLWFFGDQDQDLEVAFKTSDEDLCERFVEMPVWTGAYAVCAGSTTSPLPGETGLLPERSFANR